MHKIKQLHQRLMTPIRDFMNDSRATGILLIICTVASLVLSNLHATSSGYLGMWVKTFPSHLGVVHLPDNFLHLINDVLMSFFFFLVGMEIKRELTIGELASVRKSLLPVLAALGGMVCPAIIYTIFNGHTPFHHGWGIPMATDIAFSLGILSLLGNKVPVQLKIFLTALAIIDDLGAVITIAVFYSSQLNLLYLLFAGIALAVIIGLNLFKVQRLFFYVIPAVVLWYCVFNSGIHATIAGVILAFSMPLSRVAKLEHYLHVPVNFLIMPLFALANTAVIFPHEFGSIFTSTISYGVMIGLFLGKPIGIFLFSFLATKLGIASLPSKTTYKQLFGVGMLGGIGFTMSIFTATLAFNAESLQVIAKVAILAGSILSGIAGYIYLSRYKPVTSPRAVGEFNHQMQQEEGEFYVPSLNEQPALA
jgi:Na+:H+ antiporter, NhaA family